MKTTMARSLKMMAIATTGIATAGAVGAYATNRPAPERADCPGKIVCPATGDLVCADRCPLEADQAAASPAAEAVDATHAAELPPCCASAK